MKKVMLDFETFGSGPNAMVKQIGACYFNDTTGEIGETFKMNVEVGPGFTAREHMGDIDPKTVEWWIGQSEGARNSILTGIQTDYKTAFLALNAFLANANEIWSHATFDFVILCETLKRLNINQSFSYRAGLDLRTLMRLAKVNKNEYPTRSGIHHDALDDCYFQVQYAVVAFNKLGRKI